MLKTIIFSLRYAAPVRRELGIRTIIKYKIGPLANPAGAKMELMGVMMKS
ncbi:hypothetical protein [endosymbiont 'TC1' of Trimyema compressum]